MAARLPAAVSYLPPRPKERQPAGKDLGHKEPPPKPRPITPPPRARTPPRAKTPPKPKPKSPPPQPKRQKTPPRKIDLPKPRHDGKRSPDPEQEYLRQRRHSAHDEYGNHDDDDYTHVNHNNHRKPPKPPTVVPAVRKTQPVKKDRMEKNRKAITPGPPTRGDAGRSRGSRWGAPRRYGFEDPLIDGAGRQFKARLVTFYKNGDAFFSGIKASFRPGRDFVSMEGLLNYLNSRMDLPLGVRYVFTVDGRRVRRLDEFENGAAYVCSSRRKFEPMTYGAVNRKMWNPHLKFETPLDKKLFRAPSPTLKRLNGYRDRWSPDGPVPGSREGRVIKVINNLNHKIQSRILLNLRTAQPWEEVLEDLGQTLRMKGAKKLYTINGQEVRSFSQLRHEFKDVETFYLDTGESHLLRGQRFDPRKESSRSLEDNPPPRPRDKRDNSYDRAREIVPSDDSSPDSSLAPIRILINGARRDFYPPVQHRLRPDNAPPEKTLQLDWVYGYRGYDSKINLEVLPSGELIYYVATVVVLYDKYKHKQRHYLGHTEDITCLALTYNKEICATGQKEGKGKSGLAHVRIWDVQSLDTLALIGINDVDNGIAALAFSKQNKGSYLMVIDDSADHMLSLWDWRRDRILGKTPTYSREVNGGQFYPNDDNLIITYGRSHLTAWNRRKDGMFQKYELLKAVGDNVLSIEFDEDGDLIAGDSSGAISVWTEDHDGGFQLCKEFQAHQRGVTSLLVLPEGTLLSGSLDRYIKAWRNLKQYKLMATTMLPDTAGGVRTLCPQRQGSEDSSIYVGTTRNMILDGSLYRRFSIVVQGHYKNLSAIAVDPDYSSFVTAGEDRSICKWSMHKLLWRVQIESECTCLAFHPTDLVVVVGTEDGHFLALNADSGMHIATVTVSKIAISCVTFNDDGNLFAVACRDGNIYLYAVSNSGFAYRRRNIIRGTEVLRHMDFSTDSRYLQSDTEDYDLIFWDIQHLEQETLPSTVRDVHWSSITCTLGYSINGIWNNANQRIQGLLLSCHVSRLHWLLAAADDEGYIRLFRYPCISPNAEFYEVKPYTGPVHMIRFLYDDSFLITSGGYDAALMQWMVTN